MAEIIPIIIGPILQSCDTPLKVKAAESGDLSQANGPELNLDSDEEFEQGKKNFSFSLLYEKNSYIKCS